MAFPVHGMLSNFNRNLIFGYRRRNNYSADQQWKCGRVGDGKSLVFYH